jgi:zinc transporter 1/2/3
MFFHLSSAVSLSYYTNNIHQLLAPACDALTDSCLTGPITEYDWAEGIALITIFFLFFIELLAMRYATFSPFGQGSYEQPEAGLTNPPASLKLVGTIKSESTTQGEETPQPPAHSHAPGEDHLSHAREHQDIDAESGDAHDHSHTGIIAESYAAQLTALFILEFGVVFHSIFIGLTLAVAGTEFKTLYVVLVFHQTFEGLGLGARLAATPFPKGKRWTPYVMAIVYGLATPISIAIGLGVRKTYPPNSQTTLIVNGIFDSVSAGILIYTGLVELMAHEFLFSNQLRSAKASTLYLAFGTMVLGAGK